MIAEIIVAFVTLIVLVIVRFYWIWYSLCRKVGVFGPFPLPIIGNNLPLFKENPGIVGFDRQNLKKYGKIVPLMDFWNPQIFVFDTDLLKQIQVRDFESYSDRGAYCLIGPPLSVNLIQLVGQRWKRVRTIVTPTFTSGKLKVVYHVMRTMVDFCMGDIEESCQSKESLDVQKLFGVYTGGNILAMAFGLDVTQTLGKDRSFFADNLEKPLLEVSNKNWKFNLGLAMPFFFKTVADEKGDADVSFIPKENCKIIMDMLDRVYEERTSGVTRNDFFQLLMNARGKFSGEGESKLSKDELYANATAFIIAGFETTMTALSYSSTMLASHPEIQEECAQEVDRVLEEENSPFLKYEHIGKLKLIDVVLKETLRLYTPIRRFYRLCGQKTNLAGIEVDPGTMICIPAHVVHRMPEYWGADADAFNPKRFFERPGEDPAFQAFGMGQRSCIGERLALLEAKLIIGEIIRKYRFVPAKDSVVYIKQTVMGKNSETFLFPKQIPPQVYSWTWLTKAPHPIVLGIERRLKE